MNEPLNTCGTELAWDNELAIEAALIAIFEKFVAAVNCKDIQGVERLLHASSNSRNEVLMSYEKLFDAYTFQVDITGHVYGGTDGDFSYCRFTQRFERIAGPEMKNFTIENLVIYRRFEDRWLVWNRVPLWVSPDEN